MDGERNMADKPAKYLDKDEWTVEQHLTYMRGGKRPLNPEWQRARNEVLEDAGFEPDQETEGPPIGESADPARHHAAIRRHKD
jgi:hypothetical protein